MHSTNFTGADGGLGVVTMATVVPRIQPIRLHTEERNNQSQTGKETAKATKTSRHSLPLKLVLDGRGEPTLEIEMEGIVILIETAPDTTA